MSNLFELSFQTGFLLLSQGEPTADGLGGFTYAEPDEVAFNGGIRLLTAREKDVGGKNALDATHRIYASYGLEVSRVDKISFQGITYQVVSVDNVAGKNELLQIDVKCLT